MATNNAPKHDFAPAWLKIPTNENTKPPSSKQGENGEAKNNHSYQNRGDSTTKSPLGLEHTKLYQQHSFDQSCYDRSKRTAPGSNSKSRHHSVDDDYYAFNYGAYAYYNGYSYGDKYDAHFGSQPSLVRTPGQRDNKYQHPHARQTLGYPPYYDLLQPYEYYGNLDYYSSYQSSRGGTSRKGFSEKERSNSKESKERDENTEKKDGDGKPFIDDFPSLNGGFDKITETTKGSKQMNGTSGVWDKPRKSGTTNKGVVETETIDSSQNKVLRDANIYKNLVPTKSAIPRRPARMNGSYSKEQGPLWGLKPSVTISGSSPPGVNSKETNGPPSTPPMDILNTRFVTQPRTLSDKKSNFLKALRQEDEKRTDKKYINADGDLINGTDRLNISEDCSHLSSSLEAEQRLLREMGWNEADEEEYEITEDDKKQFHNLAKHQQQRNGPRSIPKTWSPKHIPLYQPNVNEMNETMSSSDSDSDDNCEN